MFFLSSHFPANKAASDTDLMFQFCLPNIKKSHSFDIFGSMNFKLSLPVQEGMTFWFSEKVLIKWKQGVALLEGSHCRSDAYLYLFFMTIPLQLFLDNSALMLVADDEYINLDVIVIAQRNYPGSAQHHVIFDEMCKLTYIHVHIC